MDVKTGIFWTVLSLLLVCTAQAGSIYTWTDADGVKRYSNEQPPEEIKNVETINELKTDQDGSTKVRQGYDRMVEKASQEADREIEQQTRKKAKKRDAARQKAKNEECKKLEQARQNLQEELDAISERGLSTTFSAGQKTYLMEQVQVKIDQIDNQLNACLNR